MYEGQRDQMAAQAFNIEQTAFAIETVKDTQNTVLAMKVFINELISLKLLKLADRYFSPFILA